MLKACVFMVLGSVGVISTLSCVLNMLYIKAVKKNIGTFDVVKTVLVAIVTVFFLSNMNINPTGEFSGPISLVFLLFLTSGIVGVIWLFIARIDSSAKTINK